MLDSIPTGPSEPDDLRSYQGLHGTGNSADATFKPYIRQDPTLERDKTEEPALEAKQLKDNGLELPAVELLAVETTFETIV